MIDKYKKMDETKKVEIKVNLKSNVTEDQKSKTSAAALERLYEQIFEKKKN